MSKTLTVEEEKLLEHAKQTVTAYNKMRESHDGIDTLYSFLMTEDDKIYDGACLESSANQAGICAERHAIANMVMADSYTAKIKCIVVADPVPEKQERSTPPCGACRHMIKEFSSPTTTVICVQYSHEKDSWIFLTYEKYLISELYPHPYAPKPGLWD